jgi:hypothetical protein
VIARTAFTQRWAQAQKDWAFALAVVLLHISGDVLNPAQLRRSSQPFGIDLHIVCCNELSVSALSTNQIGRGPRFKSALTFRPNPSRQMQPPPS